MLRDTKKTEELLEGLKDENVSVENIDKFLQHKGVVVDVHAGRLRNTVDVNPKMYGVDVAQSEELTTFFKDYIKKGKMCFIPQSYEKQFQTIETSIRNKQRQLALGYGNKYMPIETYKEFKKYFEQKKKDYLFVRDDIATVWNSLMDTFRYTLDVALDEMNALDKTTLKKQILAKLPSKDEYINSIYLETSLKAFPVMTNIDLFDETIEDEIRDTIQKDSIKSVYEILSNILEDSFTSVNKVLVYYNKKGDLTEKQLKVLKDLRPRIASKNILKNGLVDEIIHDLKEINSLDDYDDIAEKCECVLARIYGFAKDIEVDMYLDLSNSVLSVDELSSIYEALDN